MTLVDDLVALLGTDRVLSEPLERYLYGTDAGVSRGEAIAVVLPESSREVAAVVRVARQHAVPVVPRGAGTGLAGGAAPARPGLVVSLTRMNRIEIDEENHTAWVEPGVVNLDLSRHTAPLGYHFAPDPSSQSACTIGGNVANNSGGPHCLAEGTTTAHVLAVEVVTAEGEVITLGGSAPDPIGLDLRAVVVGSEGMLGIITRALVRLTPNPPEVRTILAAFESVEQSVATATGIIARGIVPAALEIMDQRMTVAVERFVSAGFPTDAGAVLLAEVAGHASAVEAEAAVVESVARENSALMLRVASNEAERAKLWLGRKSAFGAVAQMAPDYYLHDTVVPRTKLVETMRRVYEIAEAHGVEMLNVFHAGDGNLHPLVAFDASKEGALDLVHVAMEEVAKACIAAGGALSGEHGIGLEKRDLMPLLYGQADLDAQARLREAFDPAGMFNPDKVLPSGARCADLGRPLPEGAWV